MVSQRADVVGTRDVARANAFVGHLENVRKVTVNAAAACVTGATADLSGLTTDGPATVRFTDGAVRVVG